MSKTSSEGTSNKINDTITGGSGDSGVVNQFERKKNNFGNPLTKNKINLGKGLPRARLNMDKRKSMVQNALLGIANDQAKTNKTKTIYIDVSEKTHFAITSTFHRNTKPTDFTMRTIKLATLLSRYSPTLFSKMF